MTEETDKSFTWKETEGEHDSIFSNLLKDKDYIFHSARNGTMDLSYRKVDSNWV